VDIPVNYIIVEDTMENKPSGYSSLSYFWSGIEQERDKSLIISGGTKNTAFSLTR
jgi:hypothetical protein